MKKKTGKDLTTKKRTSLFSISNEELVNKTPKRAKLFLVGSEKEVVRNFKLIQGGKA